MWEIDLITGGILSLVLKSTKQGPLATITKYYRKEWVFFYQNYNISCFVKKKKGITKV